jgi:hypothetical protein
MREAKPMRSTEIATLAAALRANPDCAARVAAILESMAAEVAELEAQPVPACLREPESARH